MAHEGQHTGGHGTEVSTPEVDESEPTDAVSDVPIDRLKRTLDRLLE